MVKIRTPTLAPQGRQAEQVSTGTGTALRGLGGSLQGVADKFSAYYEEQAADEADLLWAQSQFDWGQHYNTSAKQAGNGFTAQTMKDYDEHSAKFMGRVPERQIENMRNQFARQRFGVEKNALATEAAARARARAKARAETNRLRGLAMLNTPTEEKFNELSEGQPDATQRNLLGIYASTVTNNGDRGATLSLKERLEGGNEFDHLLTASTKAKLMNTIDKAEAKFGREDKIAINGMVDDTIARVSNGGDAKGELDAIEGAIDASYVSDVEKAELIAEATEGVKFAEATYDVGEQPIATSVANLKAMPRETAEDFKQIGIYQRALAEHSAALKDDPAQVALGNIEGGAELFDTVMNGPTAEARAAATEAYMVEAAAAYDKLGVPPAQRKFFPKNVVGNIVSTMNKQETGLTGQQIEQFKDTWGDNSDMVLQEMRAAGLDSKAMAQLWRSDDLILGEFIARSKNVPPKAAKEEYAIVGEETFSELRKRIYEASGDYAAAFAVGRGSEAYRYMDQMQGVLAHAYMVHVNTGGMEDLDYFVNRMFSEEVLNENHVSMIMPKEVNSTFVSRNVDRLINNAESEIVPRMSERIVEQMSVGGEVADTAITAAILRSGAMFTLNEDNTGMEVLVKLGGTWARTGATFTFDELRAGEEVKEAELQEQLEKEAKKVASDAEIFGGYGAATESNRSYPETPVEAPVEAPTVDEFGGMPKDRTIKPVPSDAETFGGYNKATESNR